MTAQKFILNFLQTHTKLFFLQRLHWSLFVLAPQRELKGIYSSLGTFFYFYLKQDDSKIIFKVFLILIYVSCTSTYA